jgi:hypothetical protein
MEKKLQDYLHYYMGATFWTDNSQGEVNPETLRFIYPMIEKGKNFQLHLRRVNDITESELKEMLQRLTLIDLADCEFEYDHIWVNATRKGVVIDCLSIEKGGLIDMMHYSPGTMPQGEAVHYLLSKQFDLFNLIDTGLAVDQKTITP